MPSSKRKTSNENTVNKHAEARLDFEKYQLEAIKTDHTGSEPADGILVSVLGILGEAGDLATLFKKRLRDGDSYTVYPDQCAEEIGDILWYMATVCTKLGLSLQDVAEQNLRKTAGRWDQITSRRKPRLLLDREYPNAEQIPRSFTITFTEVSASQPKVILRRNGKQCGDPLTDNAHFETGYRYHDVFHLAYAAVLCWSPVTRKILDCKRRSNSKTDEIEDGGRASVIEEAVAALVFQYAEKHNMLDGLGRIDSELLSMINRLTSGLEVNEVSAGEWEEAILQGYRAFRLLNRHRGGNITVDLSERKLTFQKLRESRR